MSWGCDKISPSPRSQSASTVTTDGSSLVMISGYNFDDEHQALASAVMHTTEGSGQEFIFPSESRLASAVTLRTGEILVTGGLRSGKEVWLSSPRTPSTWNKRKDMLVGRKGHATAAVMIGEQEVVVVGGGWDSSGQELASVHVYTPSQDIWRSLTDMPSNRVDFALKVSGSKITAVGGHFTHPSSGERVVPFSCSLSLVDEMGGWVEEGSRLGHSGAMTTLVTKSWLDKLCQVRGRGRGV